MVKEIERKFLVNSILVKDVLDNATAVYHHNHAYMVSAQSYQVRVEIRKEDKEDSKEIGIINIKGPKIGIARIEFEYEIPLQEAVLIQSFCPNKIKKVRYKIPYVKDKDLGLNWEVDFYKDDNEGLVTAEIEIPNEDLEIEIPEWILKEITHDDRFYNKNLSNRPFKNWSVSELKNLNYSLH